MILFRILEPQAEPLTLAQLKAHLRLDHDGDDALLNDLLRTAREQVEAATGLALIEQTWRLSFDRWPAGGLVELKRNPVIEVTSVTVFSKDGIPHMVDPGSYALQSRARPAIVDVRKRPSNLDASNGIEIDFTAGFGQSGADVPDSLKRAIVLAAAHWYEFRSGFGPGDQPVSWPAGFDRLIAPWRRERL